MFRSLALFLRDRSGAAATEMALILPVVLALIFTTLEGAHYLWYEHLVIKGVRDGARYAGRLDFTNYMNYDSGTDTYSCGTTAIGGTVLSDIQNVTRTGQLTGGTPRVEGWVNSDVTVTFSCASAGGIYGYLNNTAPRVTVSTVVNYPSLLGTLGLNTSSFKLAASAQSAVMGI